MLEAKIFGNEMDRNVQGIVRIKVFSQQRERDSEGD